METWKNCKYLAFHFFNKTLTRTGAACKKIPCFTRDSLWWWRIVKNAEIIWSYVKRFLIHQCVGKYIKSWLLYANKSSWIPNPGIMFLGKDINRKSVSTSLFSGYSEKRKNQITFLKKESPAYKVLKYYNHYNIPVM